MSDDIREAILKYNVQVPRYTSYPTVLHFSGAVDSKRYEGWLSELSEDMPLSLYLHVPFCPQMCWYCGCHTKLTKRYAPIEDYVHLLKREIRLVADNLKADKSIVKHIHFGGGSPTILQPDDFSLLMQEVREHFELTEDAEIAIELDPRGVTEEKVKAYAKEGVNRVSIGVQDFHKKVQIAINREQPFEVVYDAVRLLRQAGINRINIDLMYGLPYQTIEMIKENVAYSLLLDPDRIAFFGYAHVPWMKKHMRLIDEATLPDSKLRLEMFEAGSKRLEQEGYAAVGIDHFVKENDTMNIALLRGKLRRNFQGYTTDNCEALIGLGVSSISKLPNGYVQNVSEVNEYEKNMISKSLATKKGIEIQKEDLLRQHIIEKLMCELKADIPAICEEFAVDRDYFNEVIESLKALEKENLINIKDGVIKIHKEAKQIVRYVAASFDQYFRQQEKLHSQVT